MARTITLTARQARALHLAAQGLLHPAARAATRADVLRALRRMELLQIDTIHVVARSPYLVLFSRLGAYEPRWLDDALAAGAIFEGWAHEACFAPIEDWALHRRVAEGRNGWPVLKARRLLEEQGEGMRALLEHVRAKGSVMAAHFARTDGERAGWWNWKKEKRWLEAWLALGELMIARRERFQRVYDLRERVHPASIDLELPSAEAARRELVLRTVRALGVTQARWIHDYFRTRPRLADADLDPLVADGSLARVEVRGWTRPGYVHPRHLALARRAAAGGLVARHRALLSPFDPVVWDRERAAEMFGFDYRIECYTPAPRRRYGYFSLPILRRDELVGRLDAKAHRAAGVFEVKTLHLEPTARPTAALLADVARAIRACADWHATARVTIRRTIPSTARRAIEAGVKLRGAP